MKRHGAKGIKITDVWKAGVNPVNQEIVIYPKHERPPYPRRNECGKCWEENRSFIKGKPEHWDFLNSRKIIYECPRCHDRWEGQKIKREA